MPIKSIIGQIQVSKKISNLLEDIRFLANNFQKLDSPILIGQLLADKIAKRLIIVILLYVCISYNSLMFFKR